MPPLAVWGPPIWNLIHTLAEKIKDDQYPLLGQQLTNHIIRICSYLPCPDCSSHAKTFFSKSPKNAFLTKKHFKESMFVLHNVVNRRKQKVVHNMDVLDIYKSHNVIRAYNKFAMVYNTKGNMKLLTDTFQRQMIIRDFKRWLLTHIYAFDR